MNRTRIIDWKWITNATGLCVGFILIYNEDAGFKVYCGNGLGKSEDFDNELVYRQGTKMPYPVAWGFFGPRMLAEGKSMGQPWAGLVRYDSENRRPYVEAGK